MSKKLAIALTVVLLALLVWMLLSGSNSFSVLIDGKPVTGPFKGVIGVAGMVSALIAGFCAAIILLFVFAGAGVIVIGCLLFAGMILAFLSFPFLLPLLIPLAIVWLFIAIVRHALR
jgi:hypothetical protein